MSEDSTSSAGSAQEQREKRLQKEERERAHRASETAEQREEQLQRRRLRDSARRAAQSIEQRQARRQSRRDRRDAELAQAREPRLRGQASNIEGIILRQICKLLLMFHLFSLAPSLPPLFRTSTDNKNKKHAHQVGKTIINTRTNNYLRVTALELHYTQRFTLSRSRDMNQALAYLSVQTSFLNLNFQNKHHSFYTLF